MDGSALLTDLYQLTMAYGYWKTGRSEHESVFHLFFRKPPFGGGYTIACGLEPVIEWLQAFRFAPDDLSYLATLTGNDGKPLFEAAFLDYLGRLRLSLDLDAMPEGTVVFPHQPLIRVRGPILQGQLMETALLCLMNFNTLIATNGAIEIKDYTELSPAIAKQAKPDQALSILFERQGEPRQVMIQPKLITPKLSLWGNISAFFGFEVDVFDAHMIVAAFVAGGAHDFSITVKDVQHAGHDHLQLQNIPRMIGNRTDEQRSA